MEKRFLLLTAAKNEEEYIGKAIASIVHQSCLPAAWYIVDDGSTDRTAEIVQDQAERYPFIRLLSTKGAAKRTFGAKADAISLAYDRAKGWEFDFVAVQDADIAVERDDYYERVLDEFSREPQLGIAGGYIFEVTKGQWRSRPSNSVDSVAGGIQMFRRACFEQIGGYSPLPFGGIDWLVLIDARRLGWLVRALPDLAAHHYRPTSSANGRLRGLFRTGMLDASFGSLPLFEVVKCARRAQEHPLVLGSVAQFGGYFWWRLSGRSALLPADKVAWLRSEQRAKLKTAVARAAQVALRSKRA